MYKALKGGMQVCLFISIGKWLALTHTLVFCLGLWYLVAEAATGGGIIIK